MPSKTSHHQSSSHERALLLGLKRPGETPEATELSLDELALLADTAGAREVARMWQERAHPHPQTFLGRGRLDEAVVLARAEEADVVLVDGDLTPSQQRNLESAVGVKVVDRTGLILDIFAQHAHSSEGKLQVELAQMTYRLPRLTGRGVELSRLGGGIGTRGPGETKLEVDRRRIRRRIGRLRKELAHLAQIRRTQRAARDRSHVTSVTLVGYTNAGKSSLLNALTGANAVVGDRLFATLDSTTRELRLKNHQPAVLSDTVGFIQRLPHQLVAAFKSTLDEVLRSNLLIHVVDSSSPSVDAHIEAVERTLDDLGAGSVPRLMVYNKADLRQPGEVLGAQAGSDALCVSAATGEGLQRLLERIDEKLSERLVRIRVQLPLDRGDLVASLHREGHVLAESHSPEGTTVEALVRPEQAARLAEFGADETQSLEAPDKGDGAA